MSFVRAIDQQAGLDQCHGAIEVQDVRFHRHRDHPVLRAQQCLQPVGAGEIGSAARDADIDLVAVQQGIAALEERSVDAARASLAARSTSGRHAAWPAG